MNAAGKTVRKIASCICLWTWLACLSTTAVYAQGPAADSTSLDCLYKKAFGDVTKQRAEAYASVIVLMQAARLEEDLAMQADAESLFSTYFVRRNELDSCMVHARKSLSLGLQSGDLEHVANGYNSLGNAYEAIGEPDSALIGFQESFAFAQQVGSDKISSKALLNIGMIQRTMGNYPESLASLVAAQKIAQEKNLGGYLPNITLTIGEVYVLMGENDLASDYLHQALQYARKANNPSAIAKAMLMLGGHAQQVDDTAEALCWYGTAYTFCHDYKLSGFEAKAAAFLADTYNELGDYASAQVAIQHAITIAERDHDIISQGLSYEVLGTIALKQKHYLQAFESCQKSYRIAQQTHQFNAIANVCDCLWESAAQLGHYQDAFKYHVEAVKWRDSLAGDESKMAIARLEARLDFERQHTADSLAQLSKDQVKAVSHQAELHTEQLKSQRILLAAIGTLALGLLAAGGLIVVRRQARRLHAQNVLIQSQNRSITQALDDKEVLLREVHHRVKNNLQIMVSLLDIQADQADRVSAREILQASKGRVQSMALIHQKLYQQDHMAELQFDTYLKQLVGDIQAMFQDGAGVRIAFELKPCTLGIDQAVPLGLILNELVTNAYKYAFVGRPNGQLCVGLHPGADHQYVLTVEDDGPGLPADFELSKSETLGLNLIKGLTRQMRGTFAQNKSRLGGAHFAITFNPQQA